MAEANTVNMESELPGVLMRLVHRESSTTETPKNPCTNVERIITATAADDKTPSNLALYFLSDVRHLLSTSNDYDTDLAQQGVDCSLAWVILAFINGRQKDTLATTSATNLLSHAPTQASQLVINGSSPRPDKEADYHSWYDEEHGPLLSLVPGWNENQRFRLMKAYGNVETASFYGFNYYDKENGLGGSEWKTSTDTEWTRRVRSNHAKPNIRRVWSIEGP